MKFKFIFIVGIFLCTWFSYSQAQTIGIKEGSVVINDTIVDSLWMYNSFIKAFGKPEKKKDRLVVYHSKGIALHLENYETEVTECKVFLNRKLEHKGGRYCHGDYKGSINIEGISITKQTTLQELLISLPQYKFQPTFGWYRGEYKNIYIFITYHEQSGKITHLSIGLIDEITLN